MTARSPLTYATHPRCRRHRATCAFRTWAHRGVADERPSGPRVHRAALLLISFVLPVRRHVREIRQPSTASSVRLHGLTLNRSRLLRVLARWREDCLRNISLGKSVQVVSPTWRTSYEREAQCYFADPRSGCRGLRRCAIAGRARWLRVTRRIARRGGI